MSFDIDLDDAYRAAEDANLPSPTIISVNPENGHGLFSYLLKTPVHRFASSHREPIEWLADIQQGYTKRLRADRSFHGVALKNPIHGDWRTTWPIFQPYSLEELDCALDRADKRREQKADREFGEGRNCTVFNDLRELCYREASRFRGDEVGFANRALNLARGINNQFEVPLSKRGDRSDRPISRQMDQQEFLFRRVFGDPAQSREATLGRTRTGGSRSTLGSPRHVPVSKRQIFSGAKSDVDARPLNLICT